MRDSSGAREPPRASGRGRPPRATARAKSSPRDPSPTNHPSRAPCTPRKRRRRYPRRGAPMQRAPSFAQARATPCCPPFQIAAPPRTPHTARRAARSQRTRAADELPSMGLAGADSFPRRQRAHSPPSRQTDCRRGRAPPKEPAGRRTRPDLRFRAVREGRAPRPPPHGRRATRGMSLAVLPRRRKPCRRAADRARNSSTHSRCRSDRAESARRAMRSPRPPRRRKRARAPCPLPPFRASMKMLPPVQR